MPDTRLIIAGRHYSVTCQPGEEAHLARLGAMLDAAARKAGASGGLTETRALLFAGLLLADELAETLDRQAQQQSDGGASDHGQPGDSPETSEDVGEIAARAIEHLAARLDNLAAALEKQVDRA